MRDGVCDLMADGQRSNDQNVLAKQGDFASGVLREFFCVTERFLSPILTILAMTSTEITKGIDEIAKHDTPTKPDHSVYPRAAWGRPSQYRESRCYARYPQLQSCRQP